jgi:glycosyltransferase involved in cell wall biosynthesis
VVSVSSRLAERLARDVGFDRRRVRTIRNGVSTERFGRTVRADARAGLGLFQNTIAVGTVGRLEEVKDHGTLLRAFGLVARQNPRAVLLIAGDGPLRSQLERTVQELGLDARVRFLGHRPDVERVLAALDVFVLSSISEGLSNTILEAMACGVPVVATRVGGADELIVENETGLLAPARQPETLATAIATLVNDEAARLRMGVAAGERARAKFSLAGMLTAYESLYTELCKGRNLNAGRSLPMDVSRVESR